ncbi:ATP-binding protein [Nocardioides ferulae]|uniref:ATP-binding protein n=1 Tax=Nocardioides ferulae TaxID=2340821 RepID=UPI001F0C182A|nr:ATP-binding protein [Nocardioides ferulae]
MQDARRWVVTTCTDIDRTDLIECAELGVSELVTNALLHGEPPITVRVRGTREHPRVEVRDASVEPPALPHNHDDEDDLLLTFGRGLSIVARCSKAWGADVEDDGKTVWFNPAAEFAEDDGVEGVITGADAREAQPAGEDHFEAQILGVPLRTYLEFQRHYRELRREVRLLALAHESDYPLAKSLSDLFGSLERSLRDGIGVSQIESALVEGRPTTDLRIAMPRDAATTIDRFVDLLDLADDFCRQERLLSLARTAEQRHFQRWFLGELVRQSQGEQPSAWRPELGRPEGSVSQSNVS